MGAESVQDNGAKERKESNEEIMSQVPFVNNRLPHQLLPWCRNRSQLPQREPWQRNSVLSPERDLLQSVFHQLKRIIEREERREREKEREREKKGEREREREKER